MLRGFASPVVAFAAAIVVGVPSKSARRGVSKSGLLSPAINLGIKIIGRGKRQRANQMSLMSHARYWYKYNPVASHIIQLSFVMHSAITASPDNPASHGYKGRRLYIRSPDIEEIQLMRERNKD